MRKPTTTHSLHPRIGASFALIPITIGIVVLLWMSIAFGSGPLWGLGDLGVVFLIGVTPTVIFYGGSLVIWCPVVQWTRRKVLRTVYTSVALVVLVALAGYVGALSDPGVAAFGMLTAGLISGGIAIGLLNWIWWTPPHLRAEIESVPCPECGYDLRAQQECRCPECGEQYTLSQLLRATRDHLDGSQV
jgi:hypothetical protein